MRMAKREASSRSDERKKSTAIPEKGACVECGVVVKLSICPYCNRSFCDEHFPKHLRWEKRHEGIDSTIKKKDLMKQWKVGGV